jgi:hypothetical protein
MPIRTSTQSRQFVCAKCGPVTFRVEETETTDEIGEHISVTIDRVKGFGTCAVFKQSGGDAESVAEKCPAYAANFATLQV